MAVGITSTTITAASGNITTVSSTAVTTTTVNDLVHPDAGSYSHRNKINNGAMMIAQRGGGQSTYGAGTGFVLDRFWGAASQGSIMRQERVTVAPLGFKNSLKVDSASAASIGVSDYFVTAQSIEGNNIVDLEFGVPTGVYFSLSFWVRSSITGTHGGAFRNGSNNRSRPFTYTISTADTWEHKKIEGIPSDGGGTWADDDTTGLQVIFDHGSGSNFRGTADAWSGNNYVGATGTVSVMATSGATWYLTGVQLEAGQKSTEYEHKSFHVEMEHCRRYYQIVRAGGFMAWSSGRLCGTGAFVPRMRNSPTTVSVQTIHYEYPASSTWEASDITTHGFQIGRSVNTTYLALDATWTASADIL